jgi:KipI family sensor histidine kinase inhibitor
MRDDGGMRSRAAGESALLVECGSHAEVAAAYTLLQERRAEIGAGEIVPAARTVLLDGLRDPVAVAALIAGWNPSGAVEMVDGSEIVLPVRYDGADLDEVARQWDCTTADVVSVHTATTFRVAFCGFAPGFAYCTGLPVERAVARRTDPRARVPAGSVALADEYTGIYPTASPGGWQLIGRTDTRLWDAAADPPVLLAPGTRVRFVRA